MPTLTKEVVKQRQKISVKSFAQTFVAKLDEYGAKIASALGLVANPAYTA